MQLFFYDTCSLLAEGRKLFTDQNQFYISDISFKELENIKTSFTKDEETKYNARNLLRLLAANMDKFIVIPYLSNWDIEIKTKYPCLSDDNDSRIILTALHQSQELENIIFVTKDLSCATLAKAIGLNVKCDFEEYDDYIGYSTIVYNDLDIFDHLQNIFDKKEEDDLNILDNEYLIIRSEDENPNDTKLLTYVKNGSKYRLIIQNSAIIPKSKYFDKVKPRDIYQEIAIDSLNNNQLTVLRGPAGSGKSYLAMASLFHKLEKHEISKIIIFCNTIATAGSAKLGFYPGTKDEKLLDSQIGNFLASKLGNKQNVIDLINQGLLVLLPMSDIRGFDTSGLRAGVYITEAQNMDINLMKLALQRIGEDSICVLDGDDTAQVDFGGYGGNNNGLRRVSEIFRGTDVYGEVTLPNIYRSKIASIAQKL